MQTFKKFVLVWGFILLNAGIAFAEATSEVDLENFLEGVGDFLIHTVGPGILVIGIAIGKQKKNRIPFDVIIFDLSIFFQHIPNFFKY